MLRGSVILKCTRVPSATAPSGLRCMEFLELNSVIGKLSCMKKQGTTTAAPCFLHKLT